MGRLLRFLPLVVWLSEGEGTVQFFIVVGFVVVVAAVAGRSFVASSGISIGAIRYCSAIFTLWLKTICGSFST